MESKKENTRKIKNERIDPEDGNESIP